MRRASGDHDGDSSGCVDSATRCAFSPSASETIKRNCFEPSARRSSLTYAICVLNTPGNARQLLEDHVGDAVRGPAQVGARGLEPEARQRLAAHDVEELERRREIVRRVLGERADHEVVGFERAPLLEIDLRACVGRDTMSRVAIGANRPLLPKSALTTPAMSNAGGPEPCQPNGTTAIGTAASLPFGDHDVELRLRDRRHTTRTARRRDRAAINLLRRRVRSLRTLRL